MTPAEFDTRRRLLGLSIAETADWIGVSEKTINNYVNGRTAIHADVHEKLTRLEDAMQNAVNHFLRLAEENEASVVALRRYRNQDDLDASANAAGMPLGAHAMMIGWAADTLEAEGFSTAIEFA